TLTPVYPVTQGVSQRRLRALTAQALTVLDDGGAPELLPEAWLEPLGVPSLKEAVTFLHRPPAQSVPAELERRDHPARRRLMLEELLAHHVSLRNIRRRVQNQRAPRLAGPSPLLERFLAALPFELTAAQQRVVDEIMADLARGR